LERKKKLKCDSPYWCEGTELCQLAVTGLLSSAADVDKMRPLDFCNAAHDLISETRNKNMSTSTNNYLLSIHKKISMRNIFYYWQYYNLCVLKYTYISVSCKITYRAVFISRLLKCLQILTYQWRIRVSIFSLSYRFLEQWWREKKQILQKGQFKHK